MTKKYFFRDKLNYNDYKRFPDDRMIHEIINGKHYNHPAPRPKHQRISRNLDLVFGSYVMKNQLGEWLSAPIDVLLGEHDIVQPDKVFISKENANIITELNIQGVPDLIIEITSPIDPGYDRETKMSLYSKYKVKNYWILDAQLDVLEVYKYSRKGYELAGKYRKGDIFKPKIFKGLKVNMNTVLV